MIRALTISLIALAAPAAATPPPAICQINGLAVWTTEALTGGFSLSVASDGNRDVVMLAHCASGRMIDMRGNETWEPFDGVGRITALIASAEVLTMEQAAERLSGFGATARVTDIPAGFCACLAEAG